MKNLFADLAEIQSDGLPEELVDLLAATPSVRIERIVSHGQRSPDGFWYDQDEDEWVIVLQGRATLTIQGEENSGADHRSVELGPGDHLMIPAHCQHRVDQTSADQATLWIAVFIAHDSDEVSGAT